MKRKRVGSPSKEEAPRTNVKLLLKPDMVGLVNPTDDLSVTLPPIPTSTPALPTFPALSIVWVRMSGYKPAWTPGIVSHVGVTGPVVGNPVMVFFIDSVNFIEKTSENSSPRNSNVYVTNGVRKLPQWYINEGKETAREAAEQLPPGAKYAWVPEASVKTWNGPHRESFLKVIASVEPRKRTALGISVACGDRMHAAPATIPEFVLADSRSRQSISDHSRDVAIDLAQVRPALKLEHIKLFLETNMLELHWRTIAYAREFVKVVQDELFGGYHLIAARDWPTDEEVEKGVPEVFLVYPGQVLADFEAHALEAANKSGVHEDRNRYVAEIPNTSEILDKTKKVNLNHTQKNLFVDGLKYSDPATPIWAPGPTVNHERVQYCKLAPHHVEGSESIRGFWLQRKKGEIIAKGEPLFWSYDCGAGKFDADYGLDNPEVPPPVGWISSSVLAARRSDAASK